MPKTARARVSVARTIADEVRAFCIAKANPDLVKKYAKFFREGYDAYGVDYKDPEWEPHRQDWAARLRAAGPTEYLDCGDILTATGKYEEAAFAIHFASLLRDTYTPAAFARIGQWFEVGMRNWALTDVISSLVLPYFIVDQVVTLETLAEWRNSPQKFQRRAVAVTMVSLLKTSTDHKTMLSLVEPLVHDPEREVHQGVGWLLREIWKKDPKIAERFLTKHKETMPRLIVQYATEKMTAEQKARFKRSK